MSHAIIVPIINVKPHTNADRLQIGTASGYQVIVGLNVKEGTLGLFIPEDMQLSHEMCRENSLYKNAELNANPKKRGFFGKNRRVKAQRLRQSISMGFWVELTALSWTGHDISKLKANEKILELSGSPVCNKYFTPATRHALDAHKSRQQNSQKKKRFPTFKENVNVGKLRLNLHLIPEGSGISITEKCHGTSGRTGYLPKESKNWFCKLLDFLLLKEKYEYVSGSRRVVLDSKTLKENGHYSGTNFRTAIHNWIAGKDLAQGETLYYEIVGFTETGSPIMPAHRISDAKLRERYGKKMSYTYSCRPGEYKVLVYRITQTSSCGKTVELSQGRVFSRCLELRINTVPRLLPPFIYDGNGARLLRLCENYSQGSSVYDDRHIREGVVLRIESPEYNKFLKYKSYHFCELEGITKNSDDYVDPEEIA